MVSIDFVSDSQQMKLYDYVEKDIPTRVNRDHVTDAYGRRLLELCKTTNLLIANGRLGLDKDVDEFAFYGEKGCSVVDYLLLPLTDSETISNFKIYDVTEFSDHVGRPAIWITVGQGPTALAVGAGGGCLDIFTLIYPFSPLSPSLWETARYRLKHCLKGPLYPNQPTYQPIMWESLFD